jgi:putative ABC transport system ATP-binding protein
MSQTQDHLLVAAEEVTKTYKTGKIEAPALRGVSLQVKAGDFLAIVGPSGSGKTTLLNLVGALDSITSGRLQVLSKDVAGMNRRQRASMRLHELGFVFQAYNLVPVLTARENVEFVLELQGVGLERRRGAAEILEQLGLSEFADRRPNELSGGQQQRVAVARAVAARPKLVLADEPTANLDGENAETLLGMMRGLNEEHGITFIFSTHDPRVVAHARRVLTLVDGRVARDEAKNASGPNGDVLGAPGGPSA